MTDPRRDVAERARLARSLYVLVQEKGEEDEDVLTSQCRVCWGDYKHDPACPVPQIEEWLTAPRAPGGKCPTERCTLLRDHLGPCITAEPSVGREPANLPTEPAKVSESEGREPDAWTARDGERGQRALYRSKREAKQAANGAKVAGFEDAQVVPVYFGTPSDSPTGEWLDRLRLLSNEAANRLDELSDGEGDRSLAYRLRVAAGMAGREASEPAESEGKPKPSIERHPWMEALDAFVARKQAQGDPWLAHVPPTEYFRAGWDAALPTVEDITGIFKDDDGAAPSPERVDRALLKEAIADFERYRSKAEQKAEDAATGDNGFDYGYHRGHADGHRDTLRLLRRWLASHTTNEPETSHD